MAYPCLLGIGRDMRRPIYLLCFRLVPHPHSCLYTSLLSPLFTSTFALAAISIQAAQTRRRRFTTLVLYFIF